MAACAVSCYPNAGLPDEDGLYPETPESLAAKLERFVDAGWLNLVGGCCGTTEKHIAALAAMVDGKKPSGHSRTTVEPGLLHRHRSRGIDPGQPPAARGRAHQRHRFGQVPPARHRGKLGRGGRDRPRPGQGRRPDRRCLPDHHRARRARRHPRVLRPAHPDRSRRR